MKIEITKCYLLQIMDDDGNEIESDYVFVETKAAAIKYAKKTLLYGQSKRKGRQNGR